MSLKVKLLHIGLTKCKSTYLQKIVFPKIGKETNIKFFKADKLVNNIKNQSNYEKELPDSFILSHEGLVLKNYGHEFHSMEKAFNDIKKNFSKKTIILLIIRDPYDYLNSFYNSLIQSMHLIKPKDFFYYNESFEIRKNGKFNLYKFDYNQLINLYKSYFEKVIIVKFEDVNKLSYLKNIFNLDDKFLIELNNNQKKIINRSISKKGIQTLFFVNKFFNLYNYQRYLNRYMKPSEKLVLKIRNRLISFLTPVGFMKYFFDKLFKYEKFLINKKDIPIDIDKLSDDYRKIKTDY